MKKLTLAFGLLLFTLCASAQNKHEKTLQLFKLMELDKMMSAMSNNMMAMYGKQMSLFKDAKKAEAFQTYIKTELMTFSKTVTTEMIPVYEKYFTEHEIQTYIDFYTTPEGKKLIESAPILQKQMMTVMLKNDLPALQRKIKVKIDELKAKK